MPVKLKNIKEYNLLQKRVKPTTLPELESKLNRVIKKLRAVEMMTIRTRAELLNLRSKNGKTIQF